MRTNRMVASLAVVALTGSIASCSAPTASEPSTASGTPGAELVLVGDRDFAFDDLVVELNAHGYDTGIGADDVAASTDLVIIVVNGLDGPMGSTRDAIAGLVGIPIARAAIAVTEVDAQTDSEFQQLVILETSELLTTYGISPVDRDAPVLFPGDEVETAIERHLARPPRNYTPTPPQLP